MEKKIFAIHPLEQPAAHEPLEKVRFWLDSVTKFLIKLELDKLKLSETLIIKQFFKLLTNESTYNDAN